MAVTAQAYRELATSLRAALRDARAYDTALDHVDQAFVPLPAPRHHDVANIGGIQLTRGTTLRELAARLQTAGEIGRTLHVTVLVPARTVLRALEVPLPEYRVGAGYTRDWISIGEQASENVGDAAAAAADLASRFPEATRIVESVGDLRLRDRRGVPGRDHVGTERGRRGLAWTKDPTGAPTKLVSSLTNHSLDRDTRPAPVHQLLRTTIDDLEARAIQLERLDRLETEADALAGASTPEALRTELSLAMPGGFLPWAKRDRVTMPNGDRVRVQPGIQHIDAGADAERAFLLARALELASGRVAKQAPQGTATQLRNHHLSDMARDVARSLRTALRDPATRTGAPIAMDGRLGNGGRTNFLHQADGYGHLLRTGSPVLRSLSGEAVPMAPAPIRPLRTAAPDRFDAPLARFHGVVDANPTDARARASAAADALDVLRDNLFANRRTATAPSTVADLAQAAPRFGTVVAELAGLPSHELLDDRVRVVARAMRTLHDAGHGEAVSFLYMGKPNTMTSGSGNLPESHLTYTHLVTASGAHQPVEEEAVAEAITALTEAQYQIEGALLRVRAEVDEADRDRRTHVLGTADDAAGRVGALRDFARATDGSDLHLPAMTPPPAAQVEPARPRSTVPGPTPGSTPEPAPAASNDHREVQLALFPETELDLSRRGEPELFAALAAPTTRPGPAVSRPGRT